MQYKNYKLNNLKCRMQDMTKIKRLFEKHVDDSIKQNFNDGLEECCIRWLMLVDAKLMGIKVLEFEVVKV